MEHWIPGLARHGYALLFGVVFLEAIGLPVPAALALLIAGAAAANGTLRATYALAGAVSVTLAGDTLLYLLGRYTGWWLLGLLCRISLNPESCILRAADSFYRRGRVLLVVAKFIPGINTMAPPLAGSMNMRFWSFLKLDLAGAILYVGGCLAIGFLFSGALGAITRGYQAFGRVLGWSVAILVAGYLIFQIWLLIKARRVAAVRWCCQPKRHARWPQAHGSATFAAMATLTPKPFASRVRGDSTPTRSARQSPRCRLTVRCWSTAPVCARQPAHGWRANC
jgi:membrane protein DedA with SNARE-associated domain